MYVSIEDCKLANYVGRSHPWTLSRLSLLKAVRGPEKVILSSWTASTPSTDCLWPTEDGCSALDMPDELFTVTQHRRRGVARRRSYGDNLFAALRRAAGMVVGRPESGLGGAEDRVRAAGRLALVS